MATFVNRWCEKTDYPVDKAPKRAGGHWQRQCMRKRAVRGWSFRSCREHIPEDGQANDNSVIGLSVSRNLLWFWSSVYIKYYRLHSRKKKNFLQASDLAKTNAQSNFELLIFVLLPFLLFLSYSFSFNFVRSYLPINILFYSISDYDNASYQDPFLIWGELVSTAICSNVFKSIIS